MSITDPIANMATLIRNASSAGKEKVDVKASNIHEEILKILKREGFIENYKRTSDNKQGGLRIYLMRGPHGRPAITNIERVSKPGLRVYTAKDDIPSVLGGIGIAIISTSQGLLTDREAREKDIGGEVMLKVW